MLLPISIIGRKIMMAITGQILVIFIVFHISGNSTIFFHKLNAYVAALNALPVYVWGGRIILILAYILHVWYGTILKLENQAAKPQFYIKTNYRQTTFAGRYQIWTGVIIAIFIVYHLLQFTFQMTNPMLAADTHPDALGRADVLTMVVLSFQKIGISGIYIISLAALGLHLFHGIQSSFQTWGLPNDRTLPMVEKTGIAASVILFLWYMAIPVSIVAGLLK
jgi:succinate dehydrogenase / fumarate reductase cytochrome b subunit